MTSKTVLWGANLALKMEKVASKMLWKKTLKKYIGKYPKIAKKWSKPGQGQRSFLGTFLSIFGSWFLGVPQHPKITLFLIKITAFYIKTQFRTQVEDSGWGLWLRTQVEESGWGLKLRTLVEDSGWGVRQDSGSIIKRHFFWPIVACKIIRMAPQVPTNWRGGTQACLLNKQCEPSFNVWCLLA